MIGKKGFKMTNYIYIAQSLDGYIATKDGGINWLNELPPADAHDDDFLQFMEKIDALIMGRKTYEKVLSFGIWPYEKPVFVLSHSLSQDDIPAHLKEKAYIISAPLSDVITKLNQKGYKNLYLDGGKLIQNALKESLIHKLIITTVPILLGGGIPLFSSLEKPIKLSHEKTTILSNGLTMSHYTSPKN